MAFDKANDKPAADTFNTDLPLEDESQDFLFIDMKYRGTVLPMRFLASATVKDLFECIALYLDIPVANQKIIVPKAPLLKWPLKEPHQPLEILQGKKLMLMGTSADAVQSLQDAEARVQRRNASLAAHRANNIQSRVRKASKAQTPDSNPYTFLNIQPLQNLPNPERSHQLLEKLKNDPGIVATMRKRKYTVELLTEMEPLSHTQSTHEGTSRILGLNRNKGEVIELRLRTDAYDGYRDYKTIRRTLCHELAHNVFSEHDRNFWDLYNQIEKEVQRADWKHGGRTVAETSAYHISGQDEADEEEFAEDHGGWQGGTYVLGGVRENPEGMDRRQILARAAIERQIKEEQAEMEAEKGWRPCQRTKPNEDEQ